MADQRISQLAPLLQADVDTGSDQLPIADLSTAETKKITPAALVGAGLTGLPPGSVQGTVIADNSITALQLGPDSVGASELADNAVDTAAIQDKAVTAAKIADDSITAAQIAAGGVGASEIASGVVGNAHLAANAVTSDKIADGTITGTDIAAGTITGTNVQDGSIDTVDLADLSVTTPKLAANAVTSSKIGPGEVKTTNISDLNVTTAKLAAGAVTDAKITGPVTVGKIADGAAGQFIAGAGTGTPVYRRIAGTDLPLATGSTVGGVSIGAAGGIQVDAAGEVTLTSVATPGTSAVVTYGADGRITTGRNLTPADLPIATATTLGGVSVGAGLSVDAAGLVETALTAAEIPNLDASKIVSGSLDMARIADKSITLAKLADNTISLIQEAPPATTNQHVGTLWLQESTGQLRMWNGNSWYPVGFGRLSAENLRYCGTFDAATGLITGVTQFGTQAGYLLGQALPAARDTDTGAYFVCSNPGNATPVATGITFDNGDWILCNGAAAGWVRIDTLNGGGGGGGGGATHLNDLLDVTISSATADDILVFNSSGQWINRGFYDGGVY